MPFSNFDFQSMWYYTSAGDYTYYALECRLLTPPSLVSTTSHPQLYLQPQDAR